MELEKLVRDSYQMIYLVKCGDYSGSYIAGAFTDLDTARAVAWEEGGHVLELALDATSRSWRRPGEGVFHVAMDAGGDNAEVWEVYEEPKFGLNVRMENERPVRFAGQCWATDELHAIKIVNDRRSAWFAAGEPCEPARGTGDDLHGTFIGWRTALGSWSEVLT